IDIKPARNVDRRNVLCKDFRCAGIRQPAAISYAISTEHGESILGVAHAVDLKGQPYRLRGAEKETFQLRASLTISPVPDPDESLPLRRLLRRMEEAGIGRFVPDMHSLAPAPTAIDLGL